MKGSEDSMRIRIANGLASAVAVSTTVVFFTALGSVLGQNGNSDFAAPGWFSALAGCVLVAGLILWFISWFLWWTETPRRQRTQYLRRQFIGLIMLICMLLLPLFIQPKLAKRMADNEFSHGKSKLKSFDSSPRG